MNDKVSRDSIKNMRMVLLKEISKVTSIPVDKIETMGMDEIEEHLELRYPPYDDDNCLYKFVSREMVKRREDKITKILEEYKREKDQKELVRIKMMSRG
jgi:hypothetical protein